MHKGNYMIFLNINIESINIINIGLNRNGVKYLQIGKQDIMVLVIDPRTHPHFIKKRRCIYEQLWRIGWINGLCFFEKTPNNNRRRED